MYNQIDHASALPLHAQVEHLLRELISQNEYQNGKFLPNEVDLAKRLGISRNTVRQATNKLVHEGLIIRKKGIGTKVADKRKVITRLDSWLSFTQEMREKGISVKNFALDVKWVTPDEEIKEFFGINEDKQVLRMERLRGTEEGPIVNFISYFHPRVGLTEDEDFSKPLYQILEEKYHTVAANSKEEIKAIAVDKETAKKLDIKTGDPILFRKRFVFDPGERPIEYNLGYYNGNDFTYSIEIKRH
ncbi:MAG: GntR family transcriptional regulator [Ignavibacteria bacterium GWB2_35_6b]|nr:MAG: GntR family transcriptional regulator [Ignavibacteria bacterium GWB2_35_6b]